MEQISKAKMLELYEKLDAKEVLVVDGKIYARVQGLNKIKVVYCVV